MIPVCLELRRAEILFIVRDVSVDYWIHFTLIMIQKLPIPIHAEGITILHLEKQVFNKLIEHVGSIRLYEGLLMATKTGEHRGLTRKVPAQQS